jgi:hypothetical protein
MATVGVVFFFLIIVKDKSKCYAFEMQDLHPVLMYAVLQ